MNILKRLQWNILPNQNVITSTRCAKKEQNSLNNIYKTENGQKRQKTTKEITSS